MRVVDPIEVSAVACGLGQWAAVRPQVRTGAANGPTPQGPRAPRQAWGLPLPHNGPSHPLNCPAGRSLLLWYWLRSRKWRCAEAEACSSITCGWEVGERGQAVDGMVRAVERTAGALWK